jgi:hypothetical protein
MGNSAKGRKVIHGILPAAGLATRMRGLPKFLLPSSKEYESLLERHVRLMSEVCETIWIPTRPDLVPLINSLGLSTESVVILPMATGSMTETVIKTSAVSGSSRFLIVMPDTFFAGEQPYEFLSNCGGDMGLACWRIRPEQAGKLGQIKVSKIPVGQVIEAKDKDPNCDFPHAWGAMSINRSVLTLAQNEMPHTGYLIPELLEAGIPIGVREMNGTYYDCGTPEEYIQMLRSEVSQS